MPPRRVLSVAAALAALALVVAAARPARAQAVAGLGEDALTLSEGVVRLRVTPRWARRRTAFDAAQLQGVPTGGANLGPLRIERTALVTELGAEFGVTNWLTLAVTVPLVRTRIESNFDLRLLGAQVANGTDPLVTLGRSGVGDIEVGARMQLFSTLARRQRLSPPGGLHIRSAVAALARLGTGTHEVLGDSLDVSTGDAQSDVEARSEWDLLLGPRLWVSGVARYAWQLPSQEQIVDATSGAVQVVDLDLGDYLEVEVTPRLSLGRYFGIGARYVYRSKAEDRLTTGTGPDAVEIGTGSTERGSRLYGGVVYSSVEAYQHRHSRLPMDVSVQYGRSLTKPQGSARHTREVVLQARVYARLFGRAQIR